MKNTCLISFLVFMFLAILPGCGEKAPESANISIPENGSSEVPLPAAGSGVIRGKVLFTGTAPEPVRLDMSADPVCESANSGSAYTQDLTVNSNGTLRDAFVYIKQGLPAGAVYPVPAEAVVLDQKGCRYSPHVFGVRTNQPVTLLNSDTTLHNVHAQPKNSPEFNIGMPLQGMKTTKKFQSAEVMAHFKCDVHPWMSAYIGVMDHPFFAVTDENGAFEIKGLPAGNYTLEVWQEKLGRQTAEVSVPAAGEAAAEITFKA